LSPETRLAREFGRRPKNINESDKPIGRIDSEVIPWIILVLCVQRSAPACLHFPSGGFDHVLPGRYPGCDVNVNKYRIFVFEKKYFSGLFGFRHLRFGFFLPSFPIAQ
jgi:hypothetical protein